MELQRGPGEKSDFFSLLGVKTASYFNTMILAFFYSRLQGDYFSHGHLPEAGREIQTELNIIDEGGRNEDP